VGPNAEEPSFGDLSDTVRRVFFRMARTGDSASDFVYS
jgi:hypothetical protein